MILSENQIKVPGKMYKVRVKCVSTQRLTTIEWLILSCTKKFEYQSAMSGRTLKYAFEEVFQFQNSELLIKPCLKHLRRLEVISIAEGDNFNYDSLCFSDIELTELGDIMLKDGLLPGEPREIGLDIYYNPLTGKINGYDNSLSISKDCIDFGTESDYNLNFPEQYVIEELQAGSVGGGRFTASKYRIEEIESMTSTDWYSVITLIADVNEKNEITTTPEIVETRISRLIPSLFLTKEITKQVTDSLTGISEVEVKHIIGSSQKIKDAILDVCKNGKFIFMDAKIYELYKRNTASFKDTAVVLFGEEDGLSVENENGIFIHIPDAFLIPGCVVVNEKGEHVSLCKTVYRYGETPITVPLAVEDKRLSGKNKVAVKWLTETIKAHFDEDIRYAALYMLAPMMENPKECKEKLYHRWADMELEQIVQDLNRIHITCLQLKRDMLDANLFLDVLMEKLDTADYEKLIQNIKLIIETNCIKRNSSAHRMIVENIIGRVKAPETYSDLYRLLESLGITSHDEAMAFDDVIGKFYSEDIIKDILVNIANGSYTKLPELFELDVFFNEYVEGLSRIEKYVSDLKLFDKMDADLLEISVELCPNIAGLQSHMAEILSKNAYLMTQGINVYDVLRKADRIKAVAFFENMKTIEKLIERQVQGEYVREKKHHVAVQKSEVKRKIYILDTCALMHNPDLLLYFAEDEYVRIPTKVIDELGKIKDKRNKKYDSALSDTARAIARDINMYYLQLFNRENKLRFLIENAAVDLLPKDLDSTVPDNQILSVALNYKDWETYIVSDDGVFRLTALAQSIQAITGADFLKSHQENKKTLTDWIKQANAQSLDVVAEEIPVNTEDQTEKKQENASEEPKFQKLEIDDLPIRELRKYIPDFNEPVMSYLKASGIKTIGAFRMLTEVKIRNLPEKGKQMIYKNTVIRAVKQMNTIIQKIKLK